ncbi:porphobilinogen deaminase, dipyromethane cofactor binding domain-containing protein [Favolaschia claudopus]|uniref:hydroxymethylbilane synthase n=1 Tax=Favolaschia claudopus TaxID=2862362 RepID=A0AAW0BVF3_9AGAR
MAPRTFTLASRPSQLAKVQTNGVLASLETLYPPSATDSPRFSALFLSSAGDRNKSQALALIGGKDLWTKDLEVALKEGRVDILVHCLKDMPTSLPRGMQNPVDSLVVKAGKENEWKSLDDLPAGSVVGNWQRTPNYPDLKFLDVVRRDTRLAKLDAPNGPYSALILAKAGMVRVGFGDRLTADIPPPTLFYAVGQGALALEIRSDDTEAMELCKQLTDRSTQYICLAERALLKVLEGGCSVPVGVSSHLNEKGDVLELTGCVTSLDGKQHVQHTVKEAIVTPEDAEAVGVRLAKMLIELGAADILAEIKKDRVRQIAEAEAQEVILPA